MAYPIISIECSTLEKIEREVGRTGNGKASGEDEITSELFNYEVEEFYNQLHLIKYPVGRMREFLSRYTRKEEEMTVKTTGP